MVEPGASPVLMTGEVVMNVKKDVQEYESRQGITGPNGLVHVAHIARGDLLFGRKGKQPISTEGFGDNEFAFEVFAGWDGIAHQSDSEFEFCGVARGPPMHQDTPGHELTEAVFATQIGGSRSIECRSRVTIPKLAKFAWRIPRTDGLMPDRTKHGRLLAELFEWKVSEASIKPHNLHRMIKVQMLGTLDTSQMHVSDRAPFTNAWRIWEALQGIAYSAALVYVEQTTAGAGGVSDSQKLLMAEQFGLIKPTSADPQRQAKINQSGQLASRLLDVLLQCETDPRNKNSYESSNVAAFPRSIGGQRQGDVRKIDVTQRQSAQFNTVYDTMMTVYDDAYSRVIGMSLSGGMPNGTMDVVFKRVA